MTYLLCQYKDRIDNPPGNNKGEGTPPGKNGASKK
jgi:hypothetical protein